MVTTTFRCLEPLVECSASIVLDPEAHDAEATRDMLTFVVVAVVAVIGRQISKGMARKYGVQNTK